MTEKLRPCNSEKFPFTYVEMTANEYDYHCLLFGYDRLPDAECLIIFQAFDLSKHGSGPATAAATGRGAFLNKSDRTSKRRPRFDSDKIRAAREALGLT